MRPARFKLIHMLTGILIAVLLTIHMVTFHMDVILGFFGISAAEPTSWAAMTERATQGIWMGSYIALLGVVLYHSFYGLRGIILEVTSSATAKRIVTWCLIILGIFLFLWGSYVPVALFRS